MGEPLGDIACHDPVLGAIDMHGVGGSNSWGNSHYWATHSCVNVGLRA